MRSGLSRVGGSDTWVTSFRHSTATPISQPMSRPPRCGNSAAVRSLPSHALSGRLKELPVEEIQTWRGDAAFTQATDGR